MEKKNDNLKPDNERLSEPVQTLLKPHEFKILARLQRESAFPTISAYMRALILKDQKDKRQTELL